MNTKQNKNSFPEWYDVLAMTAIFMVASLIAEACLCFMPKAGGAGTEKEFLMLVAYSVRFLTAIGGVWLYRRLRGAKTGVFRFRFQWYNASVVLLGLVLLVAGGVVMEPVLELFPDRYFEILNDAIGTGGLAVLTTVFLAPVFEEMLFRGLILESARQKWGDTTAIVLSAALFGLVHFPIWPQVVNAFVMGVMLGYVYVLTGSLVSVMIIHAANNALAFLLLEIAGSQNTGLRDMLPDDTLYWLVYAGCLALFVVCLVSMALVATTKQRRRAIITEEERSKDI